jgi:hypothetical protein
VAVGPQSGTQQRRHRAKGEMAKSHKTDKAEIYHALYELNAAFAGASLQCRRLQQMGMFNSKASKLFPSFIEELQSEINSEFLNPLHSAEMADWSRHGKVRQRWEKYLSGSERNKHK